MMVREAQREREGQGRGRWRGERDETKRRCEKDEGWGDNAGERDGLCVEQAFLNCLRILRSFRQKCLEY